MILVTAHRRENLGEPMRNMFRAIKRIIDEYEDIKVSVIDYENIEIEIHNHVYHILL